MRLRALETKNIPPIRNFAIADLADVVVLAGPNGVGKTRLVQAIMSAFQNPSAQTVRLNIEATTPEESNAWGTKSLDTSNPADVQRLNQMMRRNRRRTSWQSSIFQFESNRTIPNLNPFGFSFDAVDPYEEMIGWDYMFSSLINRFQDTVNSIFRKVHSRRTAIAIKAEQLMVEGKTVMPLDFPDPLIPFREAFAQLLAPKKLLDADPRDQTLYYESDGQRFGIASLSSGEREVVNVVFDFILRNPADSIIIFDEPELHLHPELSYKLIQTLRNVGSRNQFIFVTHSAEIITASLDQSVIFVAPPRDDGGNQAVPVREHDTTNEALHRLGHSIGIVSLGKKIVLVEGANTSLDKQTYGAILRNRYPSLVLVPSGGKDLIRSFNALVDQVLDKTIWGVEFFMLCDRDAVQTDSIVARLESDAHGRLRVLKRYHLENYFLDENVLAAVFSQMEDAGSPLRDPHKINAKLKALAGGLLPYATALIVALQKREEFGNIDLKAKGSHDASLEELVDLTLARAKDERVRFGASIDDASIESLVRMTFSSLQASLDDPAETWKSVIPGKPLFNKFAGFTGLAAGRLKTLYIREAEANFPHVFDDIAGIFQHFTAL